MARDRSMMAYLTATAWALHAPVLNNLVNVVMRHASGESVSAEEVERLVAARSPDLGGVVAGAVHANAGQANGAKPAYVLRGNVAVICIGGVIAKHASMVNGSSQPKGTACETIRAALHTANADVDVGSSLLYIESPGGSVDGLEALALDIAASAKPVWACITDLGASAAYWIASQCGQIFAETETTEVGSIGVYVPLVDSSRAWSAEGYDVDVVKSGKKKGIGVPGAPITAEQRQVIQDRVNALHAQFVGAVARGRKRDAAAVAEWADGGVYSAREAQGLGLIDGIARVEDVIRRMNSKFPPTASARAGGGSGGSHQGHRAQEETAMSRTASLIAGAGTVLAAAMNDPPNNPVGSNLNNHAPPGTGSGDLAAAVLAAAAAGVVSAAPAANGNGTAAPAANANGNANGNGTGAPAAAAAPAQPGAGQGDQAAVQRGIEAENLRMTQCRATCQPFLSTPGVPELLESALKDTTMTPTALSAKVLAVVAQHRTPMGNIEVGESGHKRLVGALELVLAARSCPQIESTVREGGRAADNLARALKISGASGQSGGGRLAHLLDEAQGAGLRGMRLRDIARACVANAGVQVGFDDLRLFQVSMGMGGMMAGGGGHSSSDFPLLLANVATKVLQARFELEPVTWNRWCRKGDAGDYKSIDILTMSEGGDLKPVPEGMGAKYMTYGERREQVAVTKYGRKFRMTYEMFRNDDLNAFTMIPGDMGAAARRLPDNLVYTVLQANAAMSDGTALFHANHNNIAGSPAVLSYTSIVPHFTRMRKQKGFGEETVNLDLAPRFLITAPENEFVALGLQTDQYIPGNAGDQRKSQVQNKFETIVTSRITQAKAHWMVADPNRVPLIGVYFLDGREDAAITELHSGSSTFREWEAMQYGCAAKAINWVAGSYDPGE